MGYVVKWRGSNIYFIDSSRITNVLNERAVHTGREASDLLRELKQTYFGDFEIKKL